MKKSVNVVNSLCESCDSECEIKYDSGMVSEHSDMYCPFCGLPIENPEEDDLDIPEDDDMD